MPPKIVLFGVFAMLILMASLFFAKKGRNFMNHLPLEQITYLNIVRIPVEICLFLLYVHKAFPEMMTFETWNYDILAGISAPIVAFMLFKKELIRPKLLLIWNCVSLVLLLNIILIAVLSAPSPFQQLGLEQPNVGVLNFPFSWLLSFIVPLVLFGHSVSLRKILH